MVDDLQEAKLSQCLSLVIDHRGKTPKKLKSDWVDSGHRTISANNVKFTGLVKEDSIRFIDEQTYKSWMREEIRRGDLLLTSEAPAGQVCYWDSDEKIAIGQRLFALRVNEKLDSKFLNYYLQSSTGQYEINKNTSGSTVFGISAKMFDQITVRFPEKKQQEKIGTLLYDVDRKILINKKAIEVLENISKTIYEYWFIQYEFQKTYKSSGGEMVWNDDSKSEIPAGWYVGRLDDLGSVIGGSTPTKSDIQNFDENGIPWITPKDLSINSENKFIARGEMSLSEKGLKSASLKKLPRNTILLSSRAPIGYLAISSAELTTNQGFKSFVPNKGFPGTFVYYALKNTIPTIVAHASGSTFKEISGSVLKDILIILPPRNIASEFNDLVEPNFLLQEKLERENQLLAKMKSELLPLLINGQIKVF